MMWYLAFALYYLVCVLTMIFWIKRDDFLSGAKLHEPWFFFEMIAGSVFIVPWVLYCYLFDLIGLKPVSMEHRTAILLGIMMGFAMVGYENIYAEEQKAKQDKPVTCSCEKPFDVSTYPF